MGLVERYGEWIKKTMAADNTSKARKQINFGLAYESFIKKHFENKEVPQPYNDINVIGLKAIEGALKHPEHSAWCNLFAPVEILQNFDLSCLSIEMMASFLGGFIIDDYFIDQAEAEGMSPTLCSYHKCFIGAVDSGLVPPAAYAVTTSMICDANIQTFRHTTEKAHVPLTIIDTPNDTSEAAEDYIIAQLKELIKNLEDTTHKKFSMTKLRQAIERENASFAAYSRFLELQKNKYYPSTLTLQMFILFASHLIIGTPEALKFYEDLERDVVTHPDFHGKRIFWVHLMPFYQETLKDTFNLSHDYQIQASDMNLDYNQHLDVNDPLRAIAKKMLGNIFVGPLERRIEAEKRLADEVGADGIIEFCHWGCKQMSGGANIMKNALKDAGYPVLVLDGDGVDRRNSHDGQIKTRLEAFLEMLNRK